VGVLNFVGIIFVVGCIKFVAKAYWYLIFLLSCSEVMANDVRIHSASARHYKSGWHCERWKLELDVSVRMVRWASLSG